MFPWKQLADAGLVAWPDASRVAAVSPIFQTQLPEVAWYQKKLAAWGYGLVQSGNLDEQTRAVLSAFQMKYRPANIDGMPDVETAALLEALTNPTGPLPQIPVPPVMTAPVLPPAEPTAEPVPVSVPTTAPAPVADPNAVPAAVPATPPVKEQH
jgi:N-acetylmuramoyl-L-alanine amidase